MSILIDENILETLRCSLCNCSLSIPPISIISHDGTEQKCGRCEDINTGFAIRNYFFEKIAAKAKFPCRYIECGEILQWGQVKNHEEICTLRTMKCPMFQSCEEIVKVCDLRWHFQESHAEYLHRSFRDMPIIFGSYSISMLETKAGNYLVARYFTKGIFWFQVFSLFEDEIHEYELKLSCHESGKFGSSFKSRAVLFTENDHCFKCSIGECQEKSHKNSTLYNQSLPHIDLSITMEDVPKLHDLRATINIICDDKTVTREAVSSNNNSLIDRILQCPVCEEYMTPPIFSCSTGHSICNVCMPQVADCPTCRSSFGSSRNFVLEDVADNVELFCQWKDGGCNFIGNVSRLSQHHQICVFTNESIEEDYDSADDDVDDDEVPIR